MAQRQRVVQHLLVLTEDGQMRAHQMPGARVQRPRCDRTDRRRMLSVVCSETESQHHEFCCCCCDARWMRFRRSIPFGRRIVASVLAAQRLRYVHGVHVRRLNAERSMSALAVSAAELLHQRCLPTESEGLLPRLPMEHRTAAADRQRAGRRATASAGQIEFNGEQWRMQSRQRNLRKWTGVATVCDGRTTVHRLPLQGELKAIRDGLLSVLPIDRFIFAIFAGRESRLRSKAVRESQGNEAKDET